MGTQDPTGAVRLIVLRATAEVVAERRRAERDGWLLLTDTFSTRWEATIDGDAGRRSSSSTCIWWGVPVGTGRAPRRGPLPAASRSTCAAGWESRASA